MQRGSLGHNHIGLDFRGTGQDRGSLKLSSTDKLNLSTGGHIQVTDDASTANIPGRVSTRVSKESQHIGSLGRVFDFLSNGDDIAKDYTGVYRVSTLRGNLVQAVHRPESAGETDAHTSASASSIRVVQASKQSTSAASDEAVFPEDTGCVHHRIFHSDLLHLAKKLSVFGKHSGFRKGCLLLGCTDDTFHHRYAIEKFTGFLFHIDGTAEECRFAVLLTLGDVSADGLVDSSSLSEFAADEAKGVRAKQESNAGCTHSRTSSNHRSSSELPCCELSANQSTASNTASNRNT